MFYYDISSEETVTEQLIATMMMKLTILYITYISYYYLWQ